jgi:CheY-like chemotaxis protein
MQDGKHLILCIDDDPDILVALRVVLESKGYRVLTATSAAEGLSEYEAQQPDVLIVDLMMEDIDSGMKLVEQLHARNNTAPVFVLSSTGDYLYGATDMSALGVSGVFQKPLDPAVLLSLLARKLGKPVA